MQAVNVGDASCDGYQVTVTDELPAGLKVQEEEVFASEPVVAEFGFDAPSAGKVQEALEGPYGAGNVKVSGRPLPNTQPYVITFMRA